MKDHICFEVKDDFIGRYQQLVREKVLPYQEKAIHDEIEDAERSGAYENFLGAAEKLETGHTSREFYGMVFQDSDIAKWLEAAANNLAIHPDKALEKRADEMIDLVGRAQCKDGYLDTYFVLKEPDKKFTNLLEGHELYCMGHFIEAGVAYAIATGKTKLLNIAEKAADCIYEHFITRGHVGYPGHPEIELALMRLFHYTENRKYYELAKHFIDVRGEDPEFYIKERTKRDFEVWGMLPEDTDYNQSTLPVRKQKKATGHAVREVYLMTGAADVASESKDSELIQACKDQWKNIVEKRMYVTGGIGSAYEGESFTEDHHLPNDTAYAETCASIGLMMFARQMRRLDRSAEYGDVIERAFYNGVLSGMTISGTEFFYCNPLESLPGISGIAKTHKHALPKRPKWFACACCPPNIARTIPRIADYAWDIDEEKKIVFCDLFIAGRLFLNDCGDKGTDQGKGSAIDVETDYPKGGRVKFIIRGKPDKWLAVRMPYYSKETAFFFNGEKTYPKIKKGYAYFDTSLNDGDIIETVIDMSPYRIYADPKVAADSGKVSFARGPLIYCAEGVDNDMDVLGLRVDAHGSVTEEYRPDVFGGTNILTVPGYRVERTGSLYCLTRPSETKVGIKLIPYALWTNRGENEMRVWLPEQG
ncbi:MAG: glycoside hydrolase family 127 protein [Lachnospiraceae bacterium]|nr:glycoside hydrolase family 127 protein [Lachnospiraceae bacterium]